MPKEKSLLLNDIWPQERDVVVRPDRLKYVRRVAPPKGCVFCDAATAKDMEDKLVVYKGNEAMVVLNKYPYNSGHVLIMPLRHEGGLETLTETEHSEVTYLVKESVRILKKVYECKGLNVGLNLGGAAGAGIPDHLHFHVIPRWWGDTNFFPLIAETKLVVESLETTYARLFGEFAKLRKGKIMAKGKTAQSETKKEKVAKTAQAKVKSVAKNAKPGKNWK